MGRFTNFCKKYEFLNISRKEYCPEFNKIDSLYVNEEEKTLKYIPFILGEINTYQNDSSFTGVNEELFTNVNTNSFTGVNEELFTNVNWKIRGDSSKYLIKKQYALTLETSLFGKTKWVVNGSVIDKSCIRNYLMYNIGSNFFNGFRSPTNLHFVNLYIDNKYQGLYTMIPHKDTLKTKCDNSMNIEISHLSSYEDQGDFLKYKKIYYNYELNNCESSLNNPKDFI
jgi:hypothetical protein